jgi:hypothetical protein
VRREPLRSESWQPVNRWHRTLRNGADVFVTLWRHGSTSGQAEDDGHLYMDLVFTTGDADVVYPIAEQIMSVVGPRQGQFPWWRMAEYGARIDSHVSRTKGSEKR